LRKAHEEDRLFVRSRATSPVENDTEGGSLLLILPLLVIGLAGVLFSAARWFVSRGWRLIRARWPGLVLVLALGVLLSGCADMVRTVAHINGYKGDIYESPCAPQSLQAGHCVAKEGAKP